VTSLHWALTPFSLCGGRTMIDCSAIRASLAVGLLLGVMGTVNAQQAPGGATPPVQPPAPTSPAGVTPPSDYVIGALDVLSVVFWREKDMSAEVTVRPDGKISLPLLNDVQAAGLTPEQLRMNVVKAAAKYIQEPDATVVIKEIRSRNVYITGNVAKPGTYPLSKDMNVLQLIAVAGGLLEWADSKNIQVMQTEDGKSMSRKFNYNDVVKQKRPEQNVILKPNDTVVVP
jgi:polysaccharide export outer membrane protein